LVAAIDANQRAIDDVRSFLMRGDNERADLAVLVEAEYLKADAAYSAYCGHVMAHAGFEFPKIPA
jgi:hypothetical protein